MSRKTQEVQTALQQTRPKASAEFQEQLRQRLLEEFAQSQTDERNEPMSLISPSLTQRAGRRQPVLPFTLVAASVMLIVVLLLLSAAIRSPQPAQLAQIDALPFNLDSLQPITRENVAGLQEIGQLGNGSISKVAWSPDGETVAVAGSLGIWLYEADDLNAGERLLMTDSAALDVAYSPDGSVIGSSHMDGSVRLWDAATGSIVRTLDDQTSPAYTLAFSPDGTLIASGGTNYASGVATERAYIWSVETGETIQVLEMTSPGIWNIEFSPDSTRMVIGNRGNVFHYWNVETGELLRRLEVSEEIAITWNQNMPAFIDWEHDRVGFIQLNLLRWMLLEGDPDDKPVASALGDGMHEIDPITRIFYQPESQQLFAVSNGSSIERYNLADESPVLGEQPLAQIPITQDIAFSPDQQTMAVVSSTNTITLLDTETGETRGVLHEHLGTIGDMKLTRDAQTLFVAVVGGPIHVWNVLTGEEQPSIITGNVQQVILTPDEQTLIYSGEHMTSTGDSWNNIWIRNLTTGQEFGFPLSVGNVGRLTLSPSGDVLAQLGYDGRIQLLDPYTQQAIRMLPNLPTTFISNVASIAFSPDGRQLLEGGSAGRAIIYDLGNDTQEQIPTVPFTGQNIRAVGYSSDGEMFYTGWEINVREDPQAPFTFTRSGIEIWETETLEQLHQFELDTPGDGQMEYIFDAAFISDDSLLAALTNTNLRFWDSTTGEQVNLITDVNANTLLFSADGRLMITGGSDGIIRLWSVPQ